MSGVELFRWRESRGLSLRELARRLGVGRSTVGDWEGQRVVPGWVPLGLLAIEVPLVSRVAGVEVELLTPGERVYCGTLDAAWRELRSRGAIGDLRISVRAR